MRWSLGFFSSNIKEDTGSPSEILRFEQIGGWLQSSILMSKELVAVPDKCVQLYLYLAVILACLFLGEPKDGSTIHLKLAPGCDNDPGTI